MNQILATDNYCSREAFSIYAKDDFRVRCTSAGWRWYNIDRWIDDCRWSPVWFSITVCGCCADNANATNAMITSKEGANVIYELTVIELHEQRNSDLKCLVSELIIDSIPSANLLLATMSPRISWCFGERPQLEYVYRKCEGYCWINIQYTRRHILNAIPNKLLAISKGRLLAAKRLSSRTR